jgi:hypothetical protein
MRVPVNVSQFKRVLRDLIGDIYDSICGSQIGTWVDQAWKGLLQMFLEDYHCREGVDFFVPAFTAAGTDFVLTSDLAHERLQDILCGRAIFVRSHVRNGKVIDGYLRRHPCE